MCDGAHTSNPELHGCRLEKSKSVRRFTHALGLAGIEQRRRRKTKDLRAFRKEI